MLAALLILTAALALPAAAASTTDRAIVVAQSSAIPPLAGVYSGKVFRSTVSGKQEETRIYTVRLNDDLTTGTIDVSHLDGRAIAHLGFAGQFSDGGVFIGKTVVLNAPPDYIADNIRITFNPDHRSASWYHNDGRMQGSGTLAR
ncbi:MAG TPA: hypothetical protein VK430_04235 [Xanthobacteraceae bacterium]|nr:hypothetical protein [Xanthobacteraceae bacterium]